MALTAEEHEAIMECDEYVAASDAAGGKRPAEVPPPGEPTPTRSRPPGGPHKDSLGGAATRTLPTHTPHHPPEEDASAESLFGRSTHPSEGVTPHGPRTESATARKPAGKAKKLGWLTVSCPANKQDLTITRGSHWFRVNRLSTPATIRGFKRGGSPTPQQ
ncbi:hypothetical protein AB1Y20_005738 [Prymnesium parvum]|uniref:Uncharacterized protein n=1 Tax=Prymnesium parvum TaxID=97485 RepID=A0AB34J0M1_PRYPA